MGYQITYSDGSIQKKTTRRRRIKWKPVLLSVTAMVLTSVLAVPSGRMWVRDLLLPGDEEVTAAALHGLVEDLNAGEPLGDAVEAFCREIINGDRA